MKVLISLFLLFGYTYAQDCENAECGQDCTDAFCAGFGATCVPTQDADRCEVDPLIVPGTTLEAVDCDDGVDNWTVEYIGSSTQWRIINPCNNKKITFKMEDLTEYESNGKKTVNKETSFASIKGWEPDPDNFAQDSDKITNTFNASQLTKVDAAFTLITEFYRTSVEIEYPEGSNSTVWVDKNNFKYSVKISGWQTETAGNYLELCVTIKTNSKDAFNLNGEEASNGQYSIDNPTKFKCGGEFLRDDTTFNTSLSIDGNQKNQLRLCYTFDACEDDEGNSLDIEYDPLIKMAPDSGNYMSVFVVGVFSIMSLIFV